jgi:hypothetical protein
MSTFDDHRYYTAPPQSKTEEEYEEELAAAESAWELKRDEEWINADQ